MLEILTYSGTAVFPAIYALVRVLWHKQKPKFLALFLAALLGGLCGIAVHLATCPFFPHSLVEIQKESGERVELDHAKLLTYEGEKKAVEMHDAKMKMDLHHGGHILAAAILCLGISVFGLWSYCEDHTPSDDHSH